jgi:hypothetical protein
MDQYADDMAELIDQLNRRCPSRLRASEVRSECTMPRPARIQFTAPGWIATSVPILDDDETMGKCQYSRSTARSIR